MSAVTSDIPSSSNLARTRLFNRIFIYGILAIFAIIYLMPLFVMLVTSFKTMDEIQNGNMLSLPSAPTFEPWVKAWGETCVGLTCAGIKGYFWNSIKMVVPAVAISTILGALNGYVLTKWRFPGHTLVFGLMLFACFIPFQSVLLPMATILGSLGRFGGRPVRLRQVHAAADDRRPRGISERRPQDRSANCVVNDVPPRERDIAMVFQSYALYPHMTVAENITFGLRMRGVPRPKRSTKAAAEVAKRCRSSHSRPQAEASSPAASASASPWAAPSCATRRSCSTSRCPTSTPSCASPCARRSSLLHATGLAPPRSTSPTTRSRR
jgi:predicted secreted protein